MICVACKEKEATQKHHISYEPELLIDVCLTCHFHAHERKHGVGRGRKQKNKLLTESILAEERKIEVPKALPQKFMPLNRNMATDSDIEKNRTLILWWLRENKSADFGYAMGFTLWGLSKERVNYLVEHAKEITGLPVPLEPQTIVPRKIINGTEYVAYPETSFIMYKW